MPGYPSSPSTLTWVKTTPTSFRRPRFLMLRRTCVYPREDNWQVPVQVSIEHDRRFESLFRNVGGVSGGFP